MLCIAIKYQYLYIVWSIKHFMNKMIKEVAKMMDNKINMNSNSVQSEWLTKEQVQMVEEFVNAFNKRISMSLYPNIS